MVLFQLFDTSWNFCTLHSFQMNSLPRTWTILSLGKFISYMFALGNYLEITQNGVA